MGVWMTIKLGLYVMLFLVSYGLFIMWSGFMGFLLGWIPAGVITAHVFNTNNPD